jgi:hypothetical protein
MTGELDAAEPQGRDLLITLTDYLADGVRADYAVHAARKQAEEEPRDDGAIVVYLHPGS